MEFKPLTLADRPLFRAAETARPLTTSDANFTNLFIWRSYYNFAWAESRGCLIVLGRPEGEASFALPPLGDGDRAAALADAFAALKAEGAAPVVRKAPQDLVDLLPAAGLDCRVEHDPDNDDYVYQSQPLITLGGRRMHQKKNHYNHFVNNYSFECLPITQGLIPDLMAVEEGWLSSKSERESEDGPAMDPSQIRFEVESVRELLRHMSELEQVGLAIKVDGRIEAFTLGEPLNRETALVHVEKANPAIRGLYVALCSHFCREYFSAFTYINREQDLGLPGLRRSKESLKPDHLEKKYTITSI